MACDNKRVGCDDSICKSKSSMKMKLTTVWCLCIFVVGCSHLSPAMVSVTALGGNVNLSIPAGWANHQVLNGWAADCNGCSYSEPSDYFGEDTLIKRPLTPPKRSFCTVGSKISPGSFQRFFQFKPDVKEEAKVLKQKDHHATNEEIIVSLKDKTIEVSYSSRMDEKSSASYYKSVTYFGPNR